MTYDEAAERTLARILEERVILCVRLGEGVDVLEACRAAVRGGLRVLEVTLTTPGALEVIETLSRDDDVVVGAGTVLDEDAARAVAEAGGTFALSPVFDAEVMRAAARWGLLGIPGAATPAEILAAHRSGARMVKVFPAGALGGPGFLRAVRGPLPDVRLVPTGGPTAADAAEYFAAGAAAIGVGRDVFPPGFTVDAVEAAARAVRDAVDGAVG